MTSSHNIAAALSARATETPERIAMHTPCGRGADGRVVYRSITYAALERDSDMAAAGLVAIGVGRGVRCALMVKPGPEFFVLMYALFKAGAIPVLIDPGIDRRALRECLDEAAPEAFIGIPLAHAARIAQGWARRSVRVLVTVGRRWFWGGYRYEQLLSRGGSRLKPLLRPTEVPAGQAHDGVTDEPVGAASAATRADDLAAILFTSGSTGVPKGVEYTHANFHAQLQMIRRAFDIRPGEIDLPTFAPFALFDPALGMTTVLPEMDFARPGRADATVLADAIARFGVTTMFGSPAILEVLTRDGGAHRAKLATLRRVISAGAPVRPEIVRRMQSILPPDATVWTPYGATECLPVAVVEGREIVAVGAERTPQGAGILVGRPLPENTVRIIRIRDDAIAEWSDALLADAGVVGEITVAGPSATTRYYRRDAATAGAKISERWREERRIVHRMGDLGYFDEQGRLWYCGRKSHRVETRDTAMYTEQVEGVFDAHPAVRRSALVGVVRNGAQTPVLCVELDPAVPARDWPRVREELLALGAGHRLTNRIEHVLRHPAFPVDIRHNAKIGREKLALWARSHL